MIKIIFLTLAISILAFITYLAISAVKKGLDAKKVKNYENEDSDKKN
tara:strand:+ start:277 stop:417 length:141 start_codon:yes stop_codon:yes gene_type:complete